MADEETPEETPEAESEPEGGEDEPRGGKRWLLLGAIGLVVLLAGGGTGYVLLTGEEEVEPSQPRAYYYGDDVVEELMDPRKLGVRDGIDYNDELDIQLPDVAADDEDEEGAEPAPVHIGTIFKLEPFVVNITDRDRDRFLKMTTQIELSADGVQQEMEQRLPQIRDLIISLVGSKSFEEVRTIEGKNFLREEILLRVNSLLVTGKAKRIFFTEFVVQ